MSINPPVIGQMPPSILFDPAFTFECRSIGNAPPGRQIFFVTFDFIGWPLHD